MASIGQDTLLLKAASKQLCKAFGIRLVKDTQIVQLAKNASFDALFIDLEHSTLSLEDAGNLCRSGLQLGITPFARVSWKCGDGFVQRVLDAGAMGVVFPHIHSQTNIDAIASTKGVDVLLVGSNDLSVELGVPGDYKSQEFQSALETISDACQRHGKILGFAGIYENRELQEWAIKKLGAGFILGQQDYGLLARSAVEGVNALAAIEGQASA
ncbi:hypothetical protein LQW54_006367 [Pestalotiopsis sp. IQ-011]